MELYFFRASSGTTNFGDEINPWLWPQLVPEHVDTDGLLVGIGTLLNDLIPTAPIKHILGSGAGYGTGPATPDERWNVHFVRGPLTARLLNLPSASAVTDGAILIPDDRLPSNRGSDIGYMPHWQSPLALWRTVVSDMGMRFIDPTESVEGVLAQMAQCRLIITEAMHGAILADLMRIQWIPVTTRSDILDFKWQDWCGSLELDYAPILLPPIWKAPPKLSQLGRLRQWAKFKQVSRALKALQQNPRQRQLSGDAILRARKVEASSRLNRFKEQLNDSTAQVRCQSVVSAANHN